MWVLPTEDSKFKGPRRLRLARLRATTMGVIGFNVKITSRKAAKSAKKNQQLLSEFFARVAFNF